MRPASTIVVFLAVLALLTAPIQTVGLPPITLNTTFDTRELPTVRFSSPQPVSSPLLFIWNFTLDLSGRDVGSTQVRFFLYQNYYTVVGIMSSANLASLLSFRPPGCSPTQSCPVEPLQRVLGELSYDVTSWDAAIGSWATLDFRPPVSGRYHLVFVVDNLPTASISEIRSYETWTTTTIIRG